MCASKILRCNFNDKKALNKDNKVNNFKDWPIIVSLKWIYCNIYLTFVWTVPCKIEGLLKTYHQIKKFTKKCDTYLQKSSEFLSIQRMSIDIIGKFYLYLGFLYMMLCIHLQNTSSRKNAFKYQNKRICKMKSLLTN